MQGTMPNEVLAFAESINFQIVDTWKGIIPLIPCSFAKEENTRPLIYIDMHFAMKI